MNSLRLVACLLFNLFTFLTIMAQPVFSVPVCSNIMFKSAPWKGEATNAYAGFRANALHNWSFFKANSSNLHKAFTIEGVVTGDPHILNFSDIQMADGDRKFALIDLDDSGTAPLLLDATKAIIGNQVSPYKVDIKHIWLTYLKGLSGEKIDKPKVLKEALEVSQEKFQKHQEKHYKKIINDDKFVLEAAKLQSLKTLSLEKIQKYKSNTVLFESVLNNYKILDVAYREKATGGSQGLARFWYLVKDSEGYHVFEFKELTDPAIKVFGSNEINIERFEKAAKYYRPKSEQKGIYQVISGVGMDWLARERFKNFLDLDPEKLSGDPKEISDGQEVYLYILNKIGLDQAEQANGTQLLKSINKNEDIIYSQFLDLVNRYILEINKNLKK